MFLFSTNTNTSLSQLEHESMFIMNADNVTFSPFNMYSSDATEKTDVINLVVSQAPAGAERLAH
ncbi:uncharacterized protein G6M90_00g028340 [Metarhizium brunneum]|uniref:Uncharacterized protein n=1 Tax=Metarhizium brunneum TaxID=500148 RepID=A0A7D5US37_9HYPO|nr:hypothetical protein G6M90_00g028340 [Metarhizium brunneum]